VNLSTVIAFKSTYKSPFHAAEQSSLTDSSDNEPARTHQFVSYWGHVQLQHQQKEQVHSMHARHAVLVGLSYRITMQVCHSNIEQSSLLSYVQNHQSARRRKRTGWKNTLVNSSKSGFMSIEVARQTFSKFQSDQQNCNEP